VFFVVFVAAEATQIQFEVRRHAVLMSVTEVPLLLALQYMSPLSVFVVRLLAAAVFTVIRRGDLVKQIFNLANIGAGTAVACLIVARLGLPAEVTPRSWLVLIIAVTADVLVTLMAVLGVITLVQGRIPGPDLLLGAVSSIVACLVNSTVGVVVLIMLNQSRWALVLLVVLGVVVAAVYRAYWPIQRPKLRATCHHRRELWPKRTTGVVLASWPEHEWAGISFEHGELASWPRHQRAVA
jgi:hypothetical protein